MRSKQKIVIKNKPINCNEYSNSFLASQIGGWVYVLKSRKDGNLYIGSTNNLVKRMKEHNSGLVFSTKHRRPLELIYYEYYKSEADARRREKNLKLKSRAFAQLKARIRESLL